MVLKQKFFKSLANFAKLCKLLNLQDMYVKADYRNMHSHISQISHETFCEIS